MRFNKVIGIAVEEGVRIEKKLNSKEEPDEYLEKFNIGRLRVAKEKELKESGEMHKNALDRAWQNRDFEINKYWQRAAYFWGFIVLLFGAYIAIARTAVEKKESTNVELELYVVLLGIIFSLAWYLVNLGSKRWQENWEGHIDELENTITGPIYKSIYKTGTFYSVSKINGILSFAVLLSWLGLFFRFFNSYHIKYSLLDFEMAFSKVIGIPIIVAIWICIRLIRTGKNVFKSKTGYFLERPRYSTTEELEP
ncbi:MAG: hypothetical protein ABJG78_02970 [Cyclobacteriaceae bacterium]